ncbi:Uma2 family endonuclease [Agitococcus lubricus]|uniref:Uma2 family endonuclease n=1 Tax=Agitococcus lubricus TaxID=1077255 RepID=A0A2T5IZU8_9GAMM|nr:Uma2 family endonuclease [Agitococcus lubricus]PTQ89596.1 Uma2 family endonuclease [Agitococcus lubricus]
MPIAKKVNFVSEQDYLEGEKNSDIKHEYMDGDVYAMSGAHANHNRLAGNFHTALNVHLKGKPCQPYMSDMKVKIGRNFFYPDVLVDCSDVDGYFTETPTLIIEVLSKSTRKMDETTKRLLYLQIPTLLEYILVEQDIVRIEVARRSEGWQPMRYFLGDEIVLESVGLTLQVEDIYERVNNEDMREWLAAKL